MSLHLWAIRHGEVAAPYVGAFVGTFDVDLSPLGRHQAAAAAAYLKDAPLDAIVASPRRRAQNTAAPLAKETGLQVETRDGFGEMDFGRWEGLHWPDIEQADPDFAARWAADPATIPCPDGESTDSFAARVHAAFEALHDEFQGRHVALFAHAGVNRALLSHALGRPYLETFAFAQDYGCLNALHYGDAGAGAQIALLNLVPGPRSAEQGDGAPEA
ncbi:MAG: histidine phosphatase family protein [Thermoplasmatota archaeon]